MKTLILHAHLNGPNPKKAAIVMEILKVPYHTKLWEFGDGDNGAKGPIFTKINENGRVPALGKSSPIICLLKCCQKDARPSYVQGMLIHMWLMLTKIR